MHFQPFFLLARRRWIRLAVLLCLASLSTVASAGRAAAEQPGAASPTVSFVHVATALNTSGPTTLVDHAGTNGNPAAIAFIVPNRTPPGSPGAEGDHAVGLLYDTGAARWGIANQDLTNMNVGSAFNVLIAGAATQAFTQTASAGVTFTMLDNPLTNGKPDALVFVAFNGSLGGGAATYNDDGLGVFYDPDAAQWGIFNVTGTALSDGAGFNVMVQAAGAATIVHRATTTNSAGDHTTLDFPFANGNPGAVILVTQNYNPGGGDGFYNRHNIGVRYDQAAGRWSIFNEDGAAIPQDAAFNVTINASRTFLPAIKK